MTERRQTRSSFHGLALEYLLGAVAEQNDVEMVLADDSGLLMATTTDRPTGEALAAVAPLTFDRGEPAELVVDRFEIHGLPVYLCAVGDESACAAGMQKARLGIERILY